MLTNCKSQYSTSKEKKLSQYSGSKQSKLWKAATEGDLESLKKEIESKKDLEDMDAWGNTPLMQAAKYKHVKCVELLLRAGANPKAKTIQGLNALGLTDDPNIIRMLEEAGCLADSNDSYFQSLLMSKGSAETSKNSSSLQDLLWNPNPAPTDETIFKELASFSTSLGFCHRCGKEAKSKCSRCNKSFYCSRECQRSDWSDHKKACKS